MGFRGLMAGAVPALLWRRAASAAAHALGSSLLSALIEPPTNLTPTHSHPHPPPRPQDFYNLVDVYLDAVLHPRCVNDKQTFEQEVCAATAAREARGKGGPRQGRPLRGPWARACPPVAVPPGLANQSASSPPPKTNNPAGLAL
jgi:hypothetical protein